MAGADSRTFFKKTCRLFLREIETTIIRSIQLWNVDCYDREISPASQPHVHIANRRKDNMGLTSVPQDVLRYILTQIRLTDICHLELVTSFSLKLV